jgi:hypothetical protein
MCRSSGARRELISGASYWINDVEVNITGVIIVNVNHIKSSVSSCKCVPTAGVSLTVVLECSPQQLYGFYEPGGSSDLKL